MNYLWILAFCLCGGLATPITKDETLHDEMATELEERVDELVDKIEDVDQDKIMDEGEDDIEVVNRRTIENVSYILRWDTGDEINPD